MMQFIRFTTTADQTVWFEVDSIDGFQALEPEGGSTRCKLLTAVGAYLIKGTADQNVSMVLTALRANTPPPPYGDDPEVYPAVDPEHEKELKEVPQPKALGDADKAEA